jgi:hypothetical protein
LGFQFFCFLKNCNNPLEVIRQNVPLEAWQTTIKHVLVTCFKTFVAF